MFKSLLNLGEQLQGQITNLVNESTSEDEIKNEHFLLPDHELEEGVPKYMSRTYEDVLEEKNALIEQLSLLQTKSYEQQLVEERLREDLASLNNDINVLGSSTVQLITELELSQDNTSSQSTELDVLRKLCNNKLVTESGFQHQQLVGVQEVIKALWEKYAAEVAANGKVRSDLQLYKQRLVKCLESKQASIHCARESLHRAKKRLVSGSNEQSTRLDAERGILVHDLRELQNDIEEQHSVCQDLKGDNLQIASEAKQTLSRVGSTAAFSSPNKTKDLLEEKIVLERTIVGLESKLQELEAKNKQSDNSFVSNGSSDSVDGNAEPHEMEIILKEVESEKEALEAVVVNLRSKVKAFEKDMSFITHENVKKSDEIQLLSLELEKLKSNCENSCMDKEQHHLHTNGYTENKEVQVMSFGIDDQVIKFQKLSEDYENLSQLHKKAQQEMLNLIETREIQLNEKDNKYTQLMEEKDNMYKKWEDKEKFWNEQKEKFSQLIQENESLRQKFHDQEKLLNDKENMYAALVNENKNLCKKWEDKEKFLNQKTEKFSQLIQENESLHQKCQDQERFLSDKENMYAELVKENEHLCKKWEDKEKYWYQQTNKYSQLIQENESLHQKCQDQERFLNDKENMYAELVAEKEGAYEKCQKLEQDLIDLHELQSVSSKSLETSSISLQSLQSEANSEHDKIILLENEIKFEKENIDKKDHENQCLHKEIERLQDKCSTLHSNCERLEEDREKIISENKQLRESLSETAEAKDSLSMRVGLMDKERETLQDKCSTLHSNCERLEEDREKIISENKQLHESLSETAAAKDSLSIRVGLMDKERERLQDKCSTLHSNCERLEEDREKIISENKQLRESLSETAAAKDSLSMRVGLMDKEKELLQQSLMDSSQSNTSSIKIEELTEQNNALKSHLMNALSELEQLRELNNKSTTESFTSANQLALLQNEVDLLKENNVTLHHQMEKVQSEDLEIQTKLGELVQRNKHLEEVLVNSDIDKKSAELEQLRELVERSDDKSVLLESEVDFLKRDNASLVNQIQCVQAKGVEVQSKADELVLRNTQLEGTFQLKDNEFSSERANLTMQLEEKENMIRTKEKELYNLMSTACSQKETIDSLQSDLKCYQVQIMDKERKLLEGIDEKESLEDHINKLHHENEALAQRLQAAEQQETGLETKASLELQRLRNHLIQVEEGYTREALETEEKIDELRKKILTLEKQMSLRASASDEKKRKADQLIHNLQEQIQAIAEQRDSSVMQLAGVQEQALQYNTSLRNLQIVLENFQREYDQNMTSMTEQATARIHQLQHELSQIRDERDNLQKQLESLMCKAKEGTQLLLDNKRYHDLLTELNEKATHQQLELARCEEKLRQVNSQMVSKIDKTMLKNILMGYFNAPEGKRAEIVHIIGGLLGFETQELEKIGSGSRPVSQNNSWLGGWFKSGSNTPTKAFNHSFSEEFVKFLEVESGINVPAVPTNIQNSSLLTPLATSTPMSSPLPTRNKNKAAAQLQLPQLLPMKSPLRGILETG